MHLLLSDIHHLVLLHDCEVVNYILLTTCSHLQNCQTNIKKFLIHPVGVIPHLKVYSNLPPTVYLEYTWNNYQSTRYIRYCKLYLFTLESTYGKPLRVQGTFIRVSDHNAKSSEKIFF